jgi:hypothetical protein
MRRGLFTCLRDDVSIGCHEVICRLGFWSGQQDGRAKKSKCASASSLFVVLKYTMLDQKTVTIPRDYPSSLVIRLGHFSSRRSRFLSSGIRISFPKSVFHMSSS